MIRALSCVVCLTVLAACGNTGTNVVLARLNRSAKLQLLCASLEQDTADMVTFGSVLPLAACDPDLSESEVPEDANFIAAITQTQRGEVAAINFTNDLVFDTNRAVPGFTFIQVGEQPTGIQISPSDPRYTYVSSFSARTVQAIPTEEVLTGSVGQDSPLASQTQDLPSGPTDLLLYEAAEDDGSLTELPTIRFRYLYAAVPETGQIAEFPVFFSTDPPLQTLGPPTLIGPPPTADCESGFEPVMPPALGPDNSYFRICPDNRILKTVTTTITCVDGSDTGPRPVAFALDTGTSEGTDDDYLLVADANQPFVYRYRLTEDGIQQDTFESIASGTPTIALAVTPPVPELEGQTNATERYLYAIDALDGSILAIDYTGEPGDGIFGAVLPVLSGINPRANEEDIESRNRIRLGSQLNARAISVITPDYDPATIAQDLCDPDNSEEVSNATDPSNLAGVFLAVSLSDSTLRIVDIFDLNAPCRGGTCVPAETVADQFASIRRHRFRLGNLPTSLVGTAGTPSLQFDTFPGTLNPDGTPEGSVGPGLDPITCPNSMESIFGTTTGTGVTEGVICASSQVWPQPQQAWRAIWQGTIPFSQGGLGLFSDQSRDGEPGNWFVADDGQFCGVGVLGTQETPVNPPTELSQYRGDQLVIIGDLPPTAETDPACEDFLENEEDSEDNPVAFRILQAFDGELEIAGNSFRINPATDRPYTVQEVAQCFDQFTEYEVRTYQAYMVQGAFTGFVNRVIADTTTEECILDPAREPVENDPDTELDGRAFPGALYTNPLVSFEIQPFPPDTLGTSTTASLNFSIENPVLGEAIFTDSGFSALPESMLFSSVTNELFFADANAGIARIELFPLSIVQTFR